MEHMTNDKLTFMQTAASCGMGSHPAFAAGYMKGRCWEMDQTLQSPLPAHYCRSPRQRTKPGLRQ
jgi:hypothetical protein